jgi:cytochrome b
MVYLGHNQKGKVILWALSKTFTGVLSLGTLAKAEDIWKKF